MCYNPQGQFQNPLSLVDRMNKRTPILTFSLACPSVSGSICALGLLLTTATAQESPPKDSSNDAKYVVVEGQITDLVGSGIAGAEVIARRATKEGHEGPILGRASTDAFGDFAVRTNQPTTGRIVVTVTKPRHATLTREFNLDDDEFPPYLAEILGGDVRVTGRVLRADTQAPIAGASIVISAEDQEWHGESDAAGRFSIQGVPPGPGYVVVTAHGYGREQRPIKQLAEAGEIEVALQPGRSVTLMVRDELGKVIPGVLVECFAEKNNDSRSAETDAKGSVTLEGLHVDTIALDIKLTHEGHVCDEGFERSIVLPNEQRDSQHTLTMARAGEISGTVTDAASGQTLNGARVTTGILDSYSSPRDWSNYLGRYGVVGVSPGRTVVTVHLADYAPELATVSVQAGVAATLDFKLKPAAQVRGTVINQEGKPVAHAYVDATRWRDYETLGLRSVTGEDGRFVIENAPADEFEVIVSARGMKSVKLKVQAGGKPVDITVEVDPTARTGRPAAKVKPGDAAPKITLTTLDGVKLDLAKLEGKTVLLDFWATWCSPCVADLPHMADVYKQFGGRQDFVMIGVNLDYEEKVLRDFVKKRELGWHHVFGDAGGAEAAADAFGVVGIPAVFIIDANGKIAATELMGSEVRRRIEGMLEKPDTP